LLVADGNQGLNLTRFAVCGTAQCVLAQHEILHRLFMAVVSLALLAEHQPAHSSPQHFFTDLGTFGGGNTVGLDLNGVGEATGFSKPPQGAPSDAHPFLYNAGKLTDLGLPPGIRCVGGMAINGAAAVIATRICRRQEGEDRFTGFLYEHGRIVRLPTLGGDNTFPGGINDLGQVTGSSITAQGDDHAFVFFNGSITDLGTLGGRSSGGAAINNEGWVAGDSQNAARETHPFVYHDGRMTDLGTLGGTFATATAINGVGQVLGFSWLSGGDALPQRAFFYTGGTMEELGTFGGPSS